MTEEKKPFNSALASFIAGLDEDKSKKVIQFICYESNFYKNNTAATEPMRPVFGPKTIEVNGRRFKTIKKCAEFYRVNYVMLAKKLREGYDIADLVPREKNVGKLTANDVRPDVLC